MREARALARGFRTHKPPRFWLGLMGLLGGLLLVALLVHGVGAVPSTRGSIEINTARALEGSQAPRPQEADFSAARETALPDNWLRTRPNFTGVVWYVIPLDAALASLAGNAVAERAILLPRIADRGQVWLNGYPLSVGSAYTRNRPFWLPLPEHALKSTGNVLQVRVEGDGQARDGLSALELGPPDSLRTAYEMRRLFQTVIPVLLLILQAAAGFAALPLWLKTRRHEHLLFLLLCVFWLPRSLTVMRPDAGAPTEAGLVLVLVTSLFATALVGLLTLEYLGARGRFWLWFKRAMLGACVLLSVLGAVWAFEGNLTPRVLIIFHWPLFGFLLVAVFIQVRAAFLSPSAPQIAIAGALALWTVTALHDLAQIADLVPFDSILWTPMAIFTIFIALIWRTIAGLALRRASADAEVHHAVTLAAGAHGRELEQLRIEYDRKKEAERNAVIATERSRLLHDLHDGMGSQLITALRMTRREEVPREEIARVIEDSLDDMRLIIDSLDLEERDLLPLLGNLRYRLEPRLHSLGVTLQWDVEPLPELDYLTPETGLAVVRIVQEAVNNALRHAGATTITVHARADAQGIALAVIDNGHGFAPAQETMHGSHRGLPGMRARAAKLHGALQIESECDGAQRGTRVSLRLPLRH